MRNEKTVRVWEVLADGSADYEGAAGDGTYVSRFRDERAARAFAARLMGIMSCLAAYQPNKGIHNSSRLRI